MMIATTKALLGALLLVTHWSVDSFAFKLASAWPNAQGKGGASSLSSSGRVNGRLWGVRGGISANIATLPTKPVDGMKPGTSGLRKKVKVISEGLYLHNFVQVSSS